MNAMLEATLKSLREVDSILDEIRPPCRIKGEPHFIRVNPNILNPLGEQILCPTCCPENK